MEQIGSRASSQTSPPETLEAVKSTEGIQAGTALAMAKPPTAENPAIPSSEAKIVPLVPEKKGDEEAKSVETETARGDWLERSLAGFHTRPLPRGGEFALRRFAGKDIAALVIAFAGGLGMEPKGKEGVEMLALALMARGPTRLGASGMDSLLAEAGARLDVRPIGFDAAAIFVSGPRARIEPVLAALAEAIADPAFAAAGFDKRGFDSAQRFVRVAERRESTDPEIRVSAQLRAEALPGHPYAAPRYGTSESLSNLSLDDAIAYWNSSMGAERVRIAAVGDFEIDELSAPFSKALAEKGSRAPWAPRVVSLRLLPKTLALPMDEEKTTVRALFSAPERGRPEYEALAVGLVMIDDLVMEELRNGSAASSAYSAYTRLSQAAAPSASLSIRGATSAAQAKSAFTRAAALVAEGECLGVSGIAPIEAVIEGYKGRALGRIYANGAKAIDIAERVARDLAAGGDGSWYFRMAARVAAAKPEDISRIVRERIVEGASSWLASGAAGGLAGFASP